MSASPLEVLCCSLAGPAPSRRPGLAGLAGRPVAGLDETDYSVIGEATLEQRVQRFFASVTLGRHDAETVRIVQALAAGCGVRDVLCRLSTGFYALRLRLRYQADDDTVDKYAPLVVALRLVGVDCSSMGVAVDTVAAILGVPAAACTIAQVNHKTGDVEWDHVYGVAWVPRRMAMDLTERVPIGWEPQAWRVRQKWEWPYDRAAWDRWYAAGAVRGSEPAVQYRELV